MLSNGAVPATREFLQAVRARATEVGAAVNWYLTKQTKLQVAYEHTTFDGGAKAGNRPAERYVQVRWQVYF